MVWFKYRAPVPKLPLRLPLGDGSGPGQRWLPPVPLSSLRPPRLPSLRGALREHRPPGALLFKISLLIVQLLLYTLQLFRDLIVQLLIVVLLLVTVDTLSLNSVFTRLL